MAENQQHVEQVFGEVLDLPPEQRSAYLDRTCRGAPELRRLVEDLLREDERAGSFLATPLRLRPNDAIPPLPSAVSVRATGPHGAHVARFQPLDLIAGRFTVIRFIARGGMGEVYEVGDRLLQGASVALKMVLPEIAANAGGSHRFEQEVLLARKITHPSLCPIYEIFRCDEPAPPFLFLTMKLLHGQTLGARLRTDEPFTREEAANICTQLLAGVAAIHAAGVIHRDLKPNNIMLERTGNTLSVSIMDFGLARLHESEQTLVQPGSVAGTPGYLAPELIGGERPTQATDLFALGVVFHQVLTGQYPLEARNGLSVTPSPSLDTAAASPPLINAVKGFLSEDPAQRCRSFEEIRSKNGTSHPAAMPPHTGTRKFTRRRFALTAAASACALGGAAAWKRDELYNLMHPLPTKRFVAVLNWPPLSDERIRPMVLSLIDAMADGLARAEAYDHNFFVAAQKTVGNMTTSAQLNEAREALGANLVLATSAKTADKDVHVSLNVLDPTSGSTLRSREIRAPLNERFALPERILLAAAKLLDVASSQFEGLRRSAGTNSQAALAAYQTAELYRKKENDAGLEQAIEKYKEALDVDPQYALAQARLGWAYLRSYGLHQNAAALELARVNCEAASALDPALVDAPLGLFWVFEQSGNRDAASQQLSKALSLDPSNAHTLIYQAHLYADEGRYSEAEVIFTRVLRLRPNLWFAHSDYGVLLDDAGRYSEAIMQFRTAILASPKTALAYSNVAAVYVELGELDLAIHNFTASSALEPNDAAAVGLATTYRLLRRYPQAIQCAQTAVKLNPQWCSNWLELGDCYSAAGKFRSEAGAAYMRGAAVEEEILHTEKRSGLGWSLLALCRLKAGQLTGVGSIIEKAENLNPQDMTSHLLKTRVFELMGRRNDALLEMERCRWRGATVFQVQTLPDMDDLRKDPRYSKLIDSTSPLSNNYS